LTIQIFGRKKCKNSAKAKRFFQERSISFHFVDLEEKGLAPRELDHFIHACGEGEIMDTQGPFYKKGGYAFRIFDFKEEVLEKPGLLKSPLIRIENSFLSEFDEQRIIKLLKEMP